MLLLGVIFFAIIDKVPHWHRGLRHAAGNFTEAADRSERAHNTSHALVAEVDTDQLREVGALADDLDVVGQQTEELDAIIADLDGMATRMEAVPGMGGDASLLREKVDTLNELKTTLEKVNKITSHVQRHRHFFDDTIDRADELKNSGKIDEMMQYMLDAASWSRELAVLVDQLADNFVGCATLGLVAGLAVAIRSTWHMLKKYEKTVEEVQTQVRQKRDDWEPANFIITRAPTLLGVQFSSAIVGFFLLSAVVAAVLLLLTYQPLIDFVIFGDANPLVIQLVIMKVVQMVVLDRVLTRGQLLDRVNKGGRLYSVTDDGGNVIQRPVMWSWLSSVLLLFGFVTGVMSAVTRFVFHIVVSIVALFRLDQTIFPKRYIGFDAGYCAFMSVVMLRHRHTNPIWSAFLETYREVSANNNKVAHAVAETRAHLKRTNSGAGAGVDGGKAEADAAAEEKSRKGTLAYPVAFDALSDADKTAMVEAASRSGYAWRGRATTLKQRQARARWHLAYSLLNNPQLIPMRRQGGAGEKKRDYECWSSTSGSYKYWGPSQKTGEKSTAAGTTAVTKKDPGSKMKHPRASIGMKVSPEPKKEGGGGGGGAADGNASASAADVEVEVRVAGPSSEAVAAPAEAPALPEGKNAKKAAGTTTVVTTKSGRVVNNPHRKSRIRKSQKRKPTATVQGDEPGWQDLIDQVDDDTGVMKDV